MQTEKLASLRLEFAELKSQLDHSLTRANELQSQLQHSVARTNELLTALAEACKLEVDPSHQPSQHDSHDTTSSKPSDPSKQPEATMPETEMLSSSRQFHKSSKSRQPSRQPSVANVFISIEPEEYESIDKNWFQNRRTSIAATATLKRQSLYQPYAGPPPPQQQREVKQDSPPMTEVVKQESELGAGNKKTPTFVQAGLRRLRSMTLHEKYDDQANSVEVLKDVVSSSGFQGFHPRSVAICLWEVLMSVFFALLLFFVPLIVGFKKLYWVDIYLSITSTVVYALDTFICYWTLKEQRRKVAYRNENLEVLSLSESQKQRLRSFRFWIDILAAIPWDVIHSNIEGLLIIKLLRLWHLPRIINSNIYHKRLKLKVLEILGVGQAFYSIFILSGILVGFLHVNACAMFFFAQNAGFPNTPLSLVSNGSVAEQYTSALYLAVSNTFPLTYRPILFSEQWLVIALVLIGAVIYASIVGTISSFSFGLDASAKLYKQKLDEVNDYMESKRIPEDIRKSVRKYFAMKYRGKYFEETSILNELNTSLRHQIALFNLQGLITNVDIFNRQVGDGRDQYFIQRIADVLVACYFVKGDIICSQGDRGNEMFFILHGEVEIYIDGKAVRTMREGQAFGEVAMMAQVARTATAKAGTNNMLQRTDFVEIVSDFDDVKLAISQKYSDVLIKAKAEDRVRRNTILRRK